MHILHCSDLHADDASFRWLIAESPHYDLVSLAGDLLDLNPYRLPADQIQRVVSHLRQIKVPTAICSGNHDNFGAYDSRLVDAKWLQELRRPKVWLDGDRFVMGGHRFRIIPWMGVVPSAAAPDEIWLMHAPPDLSPTSIVHGGVDFGDCELGELCRSGLGPRLVLSGHVHDRQAWCAKIGRTWTLNPGRAPLPVTPNFIEIHLNHAAVAYFTTTSGEVVAEPVQRLD